MSHSLIEITKRKANLSAERAGKVKEHQDWLRSCDAELSELANREKMVAHGVDLMRLDQGRAILAITGVVSKPVNGWDTSCSAVRPGAVEAAKRDLAEGGKKISKEYFGVKNYDRFGDQREDHSYGYGPKHGSIVFSVGLTRATLERLRNGDTLTEREIEDALYLLNALPSIEEATQ